MSNLAGTLLKTACPLVVVAVLGSGCAEGRQNSAFYTKGIYTTGHEVSSFKPCNARVLYWATLPNGAAQRLFALSRAKASRTGDPYPALYVSGRATLRSSKGEDGFAADYDAVITFLSVEESNSEVPGSCK